MHWTPDHIICGACTVAGLAAWPPCHAEAAEICLTKIVIAAFQLSHREGALALHRSFQ